jgi:hypothetical protein
MVVVAQLVEHRVVVPVVAGSKPVGYPINFLQLSNILFDKDHKSIHFS